MEIKSHKDLIVWQKAMDLAVIVYTIAERFPHRETYGLISQITRSVVSVPANIAEGKARATAKEYAHFLTVARGSLMETETYILLAVRLRYITDDEAEPALQSITEVGKLINAIRTKIMSSS